MKKLLVLLLLATTLSANATIAPDLQETLQKAGDNQFIRVMVYPANQPAYNKLPQMFKGNKKAVENYLKTIAETSQQPIISFIKVQKGEVAEYQPFWIINAIYLKATKDVILKLAARDDIKLIEPDRKVRLLRAAPSSTSGHQTKVVRWNIQKVKADSVWMLGYTGQGVVIGQIDTGVDTSHPALRGKFSGHFYDATNNSFPAPYDDLGHGTHTMGTMVGGDGLGPFAQDIGVAPGATFAAAKAFTNQGAFNSWLTRSFQWFATLAADSGVNVRVINNSWGSCDTLSLSHWNIIWSIRAMGFIPVFAIGNHDVNCPHVRGGTPGNYPTVIGVGATNSMDFVASFSQRGPAPNTSPWNDTTYWSRPDWNFIKPDLTAPGEGVYSSIPGGGYQSWDGTSMATPHVSGVIALLLSKNPALDYYQIYQILTDNARHVSGYTFPNNNYGWGIVNALAAIQATPSPNSPILTFVSVQVNDPDGRLDPGDTAQILVTLTNMSDVASNNTVGYLRLDTKDVTIIDSTANFGTISHGDTVTNTSDPFVVAVSPSTVPGSQVAFLLHVTANDTFETDFRFIMDIGTPRFDYADIDTGNCVLTVTDNGGIGFTNSDQTQGNGFKYPKNGANTLFYGSLAFGNDSSYVVDNWYEHGTQDGDLVPTTSPPGRLYYVEPPDVGNQELWGMMSDSGHPSPHNVTVEQVAYGYHLTGHNDFVVVKYNFRNNGTSAINNFYAAQFIDFDIGQDPSRNFAFVDTSRYTAFIAPTSYNPVVGITLLYPRDHVANISTISNPTYVYPDTGMTDANEWKFMSGQLHFGNQASANDYSVVVSAGPFTLAPGAEDSVVFAIVGGTSFASYYAHVDSAYNVYVTGISENSFRPIDGIKAFRLAPSVVRNSAVLSFTLGKSDDVSVNMFDVTGRMVKRVFNGRISAGNHSMRLATAELSSGIYFVELKALGERKISRILVVK